MLLENWINDILIMLTNLEWNLKYKIKWKGVCILFKRVNYIVNTNSLIETYNLA